MGGGPEVPGRTSCPSHPVGMEPFQFVAVAHSPENPGQIPVNWPRSPACLRGPRGSRPPVPASEIASLLVWASMSFRESLMPTCHLLTEGDKLQETSQIPTPHLHTEACLVGMHFPAGSVPSGSSNWRRTHWRPFAAACSSAAFAMPLPGLSCWGTNVVPTDPESATVSRGLLITLASGVSDISKFHGRLALPTDVPCHGATGCTPLLVASPDPSGGRSITGANGQLGDAGFPEQIPRRWRKVVGTVRFEPTTF